MEPELLSSRAVESSRSQALLRVAGLSVDYLSSDGDAVHALREVSLEIGEGETLGILGESGSGKSSLAQTLLRLLPENAAIAAGTVEFRGRNLLQLSNGELRSLRGSEIALISQEPALALNPVLPLGRQIADVLRAHRRTSHAETSSAVAGMLREVGFAEPDRIMRSYPHQLSGGQRQRVAIAQALICRPSLVIADEPLSSLDTVTQAEVLDLLRRLQRDLNLALLFITHNAKALSALAGRAIIMRDGEVAACGTPAELARNSDPYIQGLLWPERIVTTEAHDARSEISAGPAPLIEARSISKSFVQKRVFSRTKFRVSALEDVSLRIEAGSTVALVGRSGSGKSTLARCVAGFETPDSGEVLVEGSQQNLHHHVQMLFQDATTSLNPRFTAAELIAEPLEIAHSGSPQERRERAHELMQEVGLDPAWCTRKAGEFSGGQRQRLALARALAASPRLLILDEALSGLDLPLQAQMVRLLLDLQSRHSLAYLYITHDLAFVSLFAQRIAVMEAGKIVEQTVPQDLWHSPNPATRALIEAAEHLHLPRAEAAP